MLRNEFLISDQFLTGQIKNIFQNVQFIPILDLIMSVGFGILPLLERKKVTMNLEEYREHILATRRESTVSVVNAIINSTKKEGSK